MKVYTKIFGLDVIMRHDYEGEQLEKIRSYQLESFNSFLKFLQNISNFNFENFLDVGSGDDIFLLENAKKYFKGCVLGIDKYIEEENDLILKMDWYDIDKRKEIKEKRWNAIFINHSLEHCDSPYLLISKISKLQKKNDALFIAVPDGNYPFGYSLTSSTTHFSCFTEGFLNVLCQRFGYITMIETRELRKDAKEIWAFCIKN